MDIVTGDVVHGAHGPTAVSSKLGWLLSRWSKKPQSDSHTFNNLIIAADEFDNSSTVRDHDRLTASLKRFWELESMGINSVESEIPSEQQGFVDNIRFNGTRYEVGLPWKSNHRTIDDDYELCRNRLRSLHQKLLKDPKHLKEYNRNIQEQLAMGIVEEVPRAVMVRKIFTTFLIIALFERIRSPLNYVSCTTDQRRLRHVTIP